MTPKERKQIDDNIKRYTDEHGEFPTIPAYDPEKHGPLLPDDSMADIVRALAESDPLVTHSDGEISCGLCRRSGDDAPGGKPAHLPTCLWLRARKMAGTA